MNQYENTRERFNKIVQSYLDYVALYKLCNSGSIQGVTPFDVFYWRFTYYVKYEDTERISAVGY